MVSEICKARDFAIELIQEAGEILITKFGLVSTVHSKGANVRDIVTEADLESEKLLVDKISKAYPKHRILSEERGATGGQDEYLWILDPLCGTTNYSQGIGYFAVSIALARGSEVVTGVVYNPTTKELFYAVRGQGAYLGKSKLCVSATDRLSQAFLCVEWGQSNASIVEGIHYLGKLGRAARKVRFYGSAALNLANLGAGRLDGYVDQLQWWDAAAGALIVEEAGGKVTTFTGEPITPVSGELVTTNGKLHPLILDVLSDVNSE